MNKGRLDARRQSPRKRDNMDNRNNAEDKEPPARRTGGGSIFVAWSTSQPSPPQYNMVGQFGGPCFDGAANKWKRSLQVEVDGSIDVDGRSAFDQVRHLAPDRQQIRAAVNYVGQLAKEVTGKLFITVLRNSWDNNGQPKLEEVECTMSGFWVDTTKFMTCAHFLGTVCNTNEDETEDFLKISNPQRPRAFVSNKKVAEEGLTAGGPESWPVYLLRLSRSSDIAVFELTQAAAKGGNRPPRSIQPSQLSPLLTTAFSGNTSGMSFKETDVAHMSFFAAYYPADNKRLKDSDISPIRKEFAQKKNIEDTWGLWCAESKEFYSNVERPASYEATFTSNSRSVAFGQIETDFRGSPCHGKHGDSHFAQTRECSIVGSYGCSGGMVCRLYREAGSWRSVVVGLYHGESWNDRRYNEIVAFTPDFVDAIRTGKFWSTE